MAQVTTGSLTLDLCSRCQFLWFDATEFEAVPAKPLPPSETPLPQKAREILALEKVRKMSEDLYNRPDMAPGGEEWKMVPALFGYPVEDDSTPLQRLPLLTWSIAALCAVVTASTLGHLRSVVDQFGFVPNAPWRHGGLTMLTSCFLHAGWFHLIGNLYFLLVFGDNVEDYLGKRRFLVLAGSSLIAGDLLHWLGDPRTQMPTVGASGMISGLLAFYALQFPHAKLAMLCRYQWVRFPAWGAFVCWGLLQAFGVVQQLSGFSRVSSLAHVGGAAAGMGLWLFWRRTPSAMTSVRTSAETASAAGRADV